MARATMATLIQDVRLLANVGAADYTAGTISYWTDDQIQMLLDLNRRDVRYQAMESVEARSGSTISYTEYLTGLANWEASPTILDGSYNTQGTATYAFDTTTGVCTFTSDTAAAVRIITGTVYNLNAVAAEIWTRKAAHYATAYDVSTDNHTLHRSQIVKQCNDMARTFKMMGPSWDRGRGSCATGSIFAERGDTSYGG